MVSSGASVSASAAQLPAPDETSSILKRKSNDVGWEYGILADQNNLDKVKCKLCGKIMSGGIYRIKEHIAHIKGNVSACPKSSLDDQAKCRNAITEAKNKRNKNMEQKEFIKSELNTLERYYENELQELSKETPGPLLLVDKSATGSSREPFSNVGKTQNISEAFLREGTNLAHQCLARWLYEAGVPCSAIECDSFKLFVETLGQPGFEPPSQYELRGPLLKLEVERTRRFLKKHEKEWELNGCSVMTNACTKSKRRSILNLCVSSKEGVAFQFLRESLDTAHTSEFIFDNVDKCIEEVGSQNVIQVVTHNTTTNIGAAKLLKEKRPNIFWTSCATQAINLMLESIGKLPKYKKVIDQAKTFTIFIYAHPKILSLMRSFTKKKNIVKPGVTRFASSFLTLQSLLEIKVQLRAMFISPEWDECKWSKTGRGKAAYSTMMSTTFWTNVTLCLKVYTPLVNVLRIVDSDKKPSMGFLYGELRQAKRDIMKAFNNNEKNYGPVIEIIDSMVKDKLDSPLHLMAYFLNPFYFFRDHDIQFVVKGGVLDCVEVFYFDDVEMQCEVMNVEISKYRNKDGPFGKVVAEKGCEQNDDKFDPVSWWSTYGYHTPNLQRMAKKILSLTSTSSGCERACNSFEEMNMKKFNRLNSDQFNDVIYIKFNANLMELRKRKNENNGDVLLASDASNLQGWVFDGDDENEQVDEESGVGETLQAQRSSRLRELYESYFEYEDEEIFSELLEFESDEEEELDI